MHRSRAVLKPSSHTACLSLMACRLSSLYIYIYIALSLFPFLSLSLFVQTTPDTVYDTQIETLVKERDAANAEASILRYDAVMLKRSLMCRTLPFLVPKRPTLLRRGGDGLFGS